MRSLFLCTPGPADGGFQNLGLPSIPPYYQAIEQEYRKVRRFYKEQARFFTECVQDLVEF
jgi:hypothetical protein